MPVPDRVRDDGSGIQKVLNLLDPGFRRDDNKVEKTTFCGTIILRVHGVLILGFVFFGIEIDSDMSDSIISTQGSPLHTAGG